MTQRNEHSGQLASRLRLAREHAGLSQGQVAKLLGKHRPTISEIEAGRRKVGAEELVDFSRLYDVSLSWLVGAESDDGGESQSRIQLAARELSRLKPEDMDKVLGVLRMLRQSGRGGDGGQG